MRRISPSYLQIPALLAVMGKTRTLMVSVSLSVEWRDAVVVQSIFFALLSASGGFSFVGVRKGTKGRQLVALQSLL